MNQLHPFEQRIAQSWDPHSWRNVTVIVAVSGGPDSVALLRALVSIGESQQQLAVAHFNHQLRGSASLADERFAEDLCQKLGVTYEIGRAAQATDSAGDGIEAEARRQRYQFFREVADRRGARYVMTAHTADDQAETILHRIVRGTGLAGLAGIPAVRRLSEMTSIRRPMLSITRHDVLAYLEDIGQTYREDASNSQNEFTRNRIRNVLLPMLAEQFNPQVASSLVRLGGLAGEAQQLIDAVAASLLDKTLLHRSTTRVELAHHALRDQPAFAVRELLVLVWRQQRWPRQDMGEMKWSQLCELIQAVPSPPAMVLPGRIRAEVRGDRLILELGGE